MGDLVRALHHHSYGNDPLFSPVSIRRSAEILFDRAVKDELPHFSLHQQKLDAVADELVARVDFMSTPAHTQWRNFDSGDVPRIAQLDHQLASTTRDPLDRAKSRLDLLFLNEALETGGNGAWRYFDALEGVYLSRTEGLATATLRLFQNGFFSSDPTEPLRVDAARLRGISHDELSTALQISDDNPIAGRVESRLDRLSLFADYLDSRSEFKGRHSTRPGTILDVFRPSSNMQLEPLFTFLAQSLTSIWPGNEHEGRSIGDAWYHSALKDDPVLKGIVPIHRITQWLHYAIEPVVHEICGGHLSTLTLTGLPGYRNSGLLIDRGVLLPKDCNLLSQELRLGDEPVVELRGLTIGAMDYVLRRVHEEASIDHTIFPMSKLNGVFWRAGRAIAAQRRPDGSPPCKVRDQGVPF